eukprot:TRINITY_DN349_c0_g1_i1.p1 TRINITY_DN349_c0_g1~~TRINITY_DN349_c0_g1_i1.p1  ORF type:complete len:290 (-),score=5.63 TRINITY_DN349_c0_g1_i1:172-1041(-)
MLTEMKTHDFQAVSVHEVASSIRKLMQSNKCRQSTVFAASPLSLLTIQDILSILLSSVTDASTTQAQLVLLRDILSSSRLNYKNYPRTSISRLLASSRFSSLPQFYIQMATYSCAYLSRLSQSFKDAALLRTDRFPSAFQISVANHKREWSSCSRCKTKKPASQLMYCSNLSTTMGRSQVRCLKEKRADSSSLESACCRRRYCLTCLRRATGETPDHGNTSWICPPCRGICMCSDCYAQRRASYRSLFSHFIPYPTSSLFQKARESRRKRKSKNIFSRIITNEKRHKCY